MKMDTNERIDHEKIGKILSSEAVKDIYDMAKLHVDKTEQHFDFIVSKATVLMGLLATVLMAFVSAIYGIIRTKEPDMAAVICIGAAIITTGISLFLLIFGVISGKEINTTGETVALHTRNDILEWYQKLPEDTRDKAFMIYKCESLKTASDENMNILSSVSKCYNLAIRLFVCSISVIGVGYAIFQLLAF